MAEEKHNDHEFELIPVSPLRRLEKRLDELESRSGSGMDSKEFYKELVDVIRLNQQLVDELAKANDALRIELSRLPSRLEDLTKKLDELVSFIKASGDQGEEGGTEPASDMKPVYDKLSELVDLNKKIAETNESLSATIEELSRKMKQQNMPSPFIRKPLLPPKPI